MIVSRGTLYQQTPGAVLVEEGLPADPEAHYLAKVREAMIWPYDEQCRLIGEDVWEFDPSAREFIELQPGEFLSAERAGELLAPYIKPLPALPETVLS